MLQKNRSIVTDRRLLLFKWLMVFLPSVTVTLGHSLLEHTGDGTHTGTRGLLATLLVAFLGLVLTYIFVETLFRVLRRLQAEALAREQDLQVMNAVMQERERLSRELHDGVAQLVADLLLRLDTIKELLKSNRPTEARTEIEQLRGVADEIYEDIGESIAGLRSRVTEQGLILAIQDYVDQFEERHQIIASFQTDDTIDQLSPPVELHVFRIIQEALTNVRKHAEAQEVNVTLSSIDSNRLQVVIADNGNGFSLENLENGKIRPLGLTSMQERVEALDGSFHVKSAPRLGTQVIVTIPVQTERPQQHEAS